MPSAKASNWVDRGEPLEGTLGRVLGFALGLEGGDPQLLPHVLTIRGLVEADATEVHVGRHVRSILESMGRPALAPPAQRTLGIALWHIAKAGLVRDLAERRLEELSRQLPAERPLAERLAEAILRAPDEPPARPPVAKPSRHAAERMRRRPR